jgi:hypothetical protein
MYRQRLSSSAGVSNERAAHSCFIIIPSQIRRCFSAQHFHFHASIFLRPTFKVSASACAVRSFYRANRLGSPRLGKLLTLHEVSLSAPPDAFSIPNLYARHARSLQTTSRESRRRVRGVTSAVRSNSIVGMSSPKENSLPNARSTAHSHSGGCEPRVRAVV